MALTPEEEQNKAAALAHAQARRISSTQGKKTGGSKLTATNMVRSSKATDRTVLQKGERVARKWVAQTVVGLFTGGVLAGVAGRVAETNAGKWGCRIVVIAVLLSVVLFTMLFISTFLLLLSLYK